MPKTDKVDQYLRAYEKVIGIMDLVKDKVQEEIDNDCEEHSAEVLSLAMDYAYTYAFRDIMTLMVMGYGIDEAVNIYKGEGAIKAINLDGAVMNAVYEAQEFLEGYEEDDDEDCSEEEEE